MELTSKGQETHTWTDSQMKLAEAVLRYSDHALFQAINWDAVAADAGYKDGKNAKVMYARLITALKKTKAGPVSTAARKAPRGRKPAKGGNAGHGIVKKEIEKTEEDEKPVSKKRKFEDETDEGGPSAESPIPSIEDEDDGI